jgi:hypothetical protein
LLVPGFFTKLGALFIDPRKWPMLLVLSVGIVLLLETMRVVVRALCKRQQGARIVAIGFGMFVLVGFEEFLRLTGFVPVEKYLGFTTFNFLTPGVVGLLVAVAAVHLARQFAATNRNLKRSKEEPDLARKDADEHRRAAEASRETADQANRAKSQFLANEGVVKGSVLELLIVED